MSNLTHIREILQGASFNGAARRAALERHAAEWTCEHSRRELRVQFDSLDRPQYREQCLRCGTRLGSFISAKKILAPERLAPMDEALETEYRDREFAARRAILAQFDQHGGQWWKAYDEYRRTDHWRELRDKVMERANYRCEGCLKRRADDVHHVSYEHVGDEFLWELRAVCRPCHERVHGRAFQLGDVA